MIIIMVMSKKKGREDVVITTGRDRKFDSGLIVHDPTTIFFQNGGTVEEL